MFASVKRAPERAGRAARARSRAWPTVRDRASRCDVTLDVPGLRRAGDRPLIVACPSAAGRGSTGLHLRRGRCIEPGAPRRGAGERGLRARPTGCEPGDSRMRRGDQRPLRSAARGRHRASRRSTSTRCGRPAACPTTSATACCGWAARPLAAAYDMDGAFNRRRARARAAAPRARHVIDRARPPARAATAALGAYGRDDQLSHTVHLRRDQRRTDVLRHRAAGDLPRRGGLPAQRRAHAPGGHAARADRGCSRRFGYGNRDDRAGTTSSWRWSSSLVGARARRGRSAPGSAAMLAGIYARLLLLPALRMTGEPARARASASA
ncbi:MAG: hypothetical protein MZW92_80205 [Comamonadaceae bacterium]|nr:hypothetical protein [Comamonadaceae bacterium]